MTNLHWKTTPILQRERKELATMKSWVLKLIKKVFKDQRINDVISLKQNENGKSSAVSQQHSTDSSASAKLVVGPRRRRSL